MNVLSRDQQIHIIACLTEGLTIRAIERMTGIHRDTIMRLGARVGMGCARLHDKTMVGIRTGRLELDELWTYVGKKQKHVKPQDGATKGDAWTYVALASSPAQSCPTGPASARAAIRKSLSRTYAGA